MDSDMTTPVLKENKMLTNLSDNNKIKVASHNLISPERDVRQFTEGVEAKLRNRA